jgi:hypothetical protein
MTFSAWLAARNRPRVIGPHQALQVARMLLFVFFPSQCPRRSEMKNWTALQPAPLWRSPGPESPGLVSVEPVLRSGQWASSWSSVA